MVSVPDDLLEILVCPACRGEFDDRGDRLVCTRCGLHYPVNDGIPFLRPEDGYRPEDEEQA
jgi:uncharacterized protein YbaR (Trm112 family)